MIACAEYHPWSVNPLLIGTLLTLKFPQRFQEIFHSFVASLNDSLQASTLERLLASIVATKRFKIKVVSYMHENVRLFIYDVFSNPPHIVQVNSGFTLSALDYENFLTRHFPPLLIASNIFSIVSAVIPSSSIFFCYSNTSVCSEDVPSFKQSSIIL